MQHSRFSRPILVLAAVWAAAAFGLRSLILKRSLDVNGILMADSHALLWTVLFSLVGFAVLAALCFRLNRLPGTNACFSENSLGVIPALIAATLLFFGCLFRLLDKGEVSEPAQKLCEILGIMAAAASALTALTRSRLGRTAFWTQLPLALYCGVSLVLRFRVWSHDPMIIDIAPQLLALVCMMLTSVLLLAFPLSAGHRRSTVLFGLMAFIFAMMAMPDYLLAIKQSRADMLIFLALSIWCGSHACLLQRACIQVETAPDETPAGE